MRKKNISYTFILSVKPLNTFHIKIMENINNKRIRKRWMCVSFNDLIAMAEKNRTFPEYNRKWRIIADMKPKSKQNTTALNIVFPIFIMLENACPAMLIAYSFHFGRGGRRRYHEISYYNIKTHEDNNSWFMKHSIIES